MTWTAKDYHLYNVSDNLPNVQIDFSDVLVNFTNVLANVLDNSFNVSDNGYNVLALIQAITKYIHKHTSNTLKLIVNW